MQLTRVFFLLESFAYTISKRVNYGLGLTPLKHVLAMWKDLYISNVWVGSFCNVNWNTGDRSFNVKTKPCFFRR